MLDPTSGKIDTELRRLLPFGADVVAIYPTYPGSMRTACEIIKPRENIQVLICYEEENMHGTIPLVAVMKELTILVFSKRCNPRGDPPHGLPYDSTEIDVAADALKR